jgi:leucyl/phenylalanyl-tRNA--protein transferase
VPIEPPPSEWLMPDPRATAEGDLVAVGADLEPGTILSAYRCGIFPMPVRGRLAWWSPDPRSILPLDGLRITRTLRKACRRFEIRVDTACAEVIEACADPRRPGGWISEDVRRAYVRLHELGWVHSVEAWTPDGELAGGLYGVAIGGLFAGESMFHRHTDASKVALVGLVDLLRAADAPADATAHAGPHARLLDVQWQTEHLASLGAIELERDEYLRRLAGALEAPNPFR